MKTFDEIKSDLMDRYKMQLSDIQKNLDSVDISEDVKSNYARIADEILKYLDNLDEMTIIEIGASTNSLIDAISRAYNDHLTDYHNNFERFMDDYIIGITEDGQLKPGAFYAQRECSALGITTDDLEAIKGVAPNSEEAADILRQDVNEKLGTSIPMANEMHEAEVEYQAALDSGDKELENAALVHLKEVQRDSGKLRNGGKFYLLANDQQYQAAKAQTSGMSL